MELDRIVFTTDTSELTKATDAIGTLVQEMSKISTASANMAKIQAQTDAILARAASSYADARKKNAEAADKELRSALAAEQADQKREKSTSKATEAVDKSTGATKKNSEAVSNNTTVLQRQSDILEFQAQGWSKSQAGILATAKAAKTAAGDMQELMRVLETQRKLMGTDPFDKSMSGLKSLQNQYSELKESLRQYNADTDLTMKQTKELARDKQRILEQLKVEGASFSEVRAAIRAYNAEYNALAAQYNKLANAEAGVIKQRKEMVSAANYVEQAEQKMRAALDATNSSLNKAATDDLVKYENALRKSGMSQDLMTEKLATYKNQLAQVQAQEQKRAADHLARSLSPQLTDIGVSLWSGQSPLTVLIQQGGQMMDLFRMSGVEAKDFGKVMRESFNSMLPAMATVAKGLGSFVIGSLMDAGKAATDFVAKVTGISAAMEMVKRSIASGGEENFKYIASLQRLGSVLAGIAGAGFATLIASSVGLAIGLKQVISEENNLAKALAVSGGSLNVSQVEAIQYAKSMNEVGISTGKAIGVITEMAKAGNFAANEIPMVTKSAIDMQKYAGIAIEETVKSFSKLKEKPVESIIELAKTTGMIAPEVLKAVVELEKQGKTAESVALAMSTLADVNSEKTKRMQEDYNSLSLTLIGLKDSFSNLFASIFKGIFYKDDPITAMRDKIAKAEENLQALTNDKSFMGQARSFRIPEAEAELNNLREQLKVTLETNLQRKQSQQLNTENAKATERTLELEKKVGGVIANSQKEIQKLEQEKLEWKKKNQLSSTLELNLDKAIAAEKKKIADELKKDKPKGGDSYFATTMKKFRDEAIEATTATDNLTKSQEELLKVTADPKFLALSKARQTEILQLAAQTIAVEQLERARIQEGKAEEFRQKILGKSEGLGKQYYEDIDKLLAFRDAGKFTQEQTEELTRALYEGTPVMKQYTKAIEDAEKALAKYNEESIASQADTSKENKDLDLRVSLLGKTAEQQKILQREHERSIKLSQVDLDLMKKKRDIQADIDKATKKDGLSPDSKEVKDLVQASVQAEQDAAEKRKVINRDVAVQYAEDMQREFDRISGGITDSIVTALFEGGKAGAASLRSLIVNELKKPVTLVVQTVVNAVLGNVIGGLVGGAGGSAAGGIASSIGSSAVGGLASNALGTLGAFGGAVQGFGTAALAATQSMIGMTGTVAQMSTSLAAAGHTAAAGMQSGIAAFQAIPGWGWALAGIGLLAGMMDFSGEQRFGGGYQLNGNKEVKYTAGPGGGQIDQRAQEAVVNETYKSVNSILKSLGSTLEVIDFYAGLETSGKGKGGTFAGGKLSSGAEFGKKWQAGMYSQDLTAEEAVKQFAGQMKIVTVEALKAATDIPVYLQDELKKVDIAKLTGDTAGLVLEETNRMYTLFSTVKGALELLNKPMFDTTTAGYALTETFVEMFGGIEGLKTSVSSYYDNFYSEAEKELNIRNQLTAALSEQNLTLPKTKEEYRNLVEAQDLTTEAGRKNYAVLLKNAGAFSELTPEIEVASKQVQGLNKVFAGLGMTAKVSETKFSKSVKEMFESLGLSVEDYSNSIASVIEGVVTGKIKAEDAGKELADAAVGGITDAIAQGASQAIAAQFVSSIISPVIANIMVGKTALDGIDMQAGLDNLKSGTEALKIVLNTIGPELSNAFSGLAGAVVGGASTSVQMINNATRFAGVQTPTQVSNGAGRNTGNGFDYNSSYFSGIQDSGKGQRDLEPAVNAVSSLVSETLESNKKVSELLQKLLNPNKDYANRYAELNDTLVSKKTESMFDEYNSTITALQQKLQRDQEVTTLASNILSFKGLTGAPVLDESLMQGIVSDVQNLVSSGLLPIETNVFDFSQKIIEIANGLESTGNSDKLQQYLDMMLGLGTGKLGEGINFLQTELQGNITNLSILEKELRDWYLAQARVIAVEDYSTNLQETLAAQSKTEELKRTGGIDDPISKLKEQFAGKLKAVNEGINKALQDEIDAKKKGIEKLDPEFAKKFEDWIEGTLPEDFEAFKEAGKEYSKLLGYDIFGAAPLSTIKSRIEELKKVLPGLEGEITALTEEQQKYITNIEEWYKAQAELLSTEMLVDINNQIKALETEEKGPLSTIKDAIQKYIKDFTELGTLTADIQAQLDKLSDLQLTKAREELYNQLIPADEMKQIKTLKLTEQFTELGKTLPASADELRKMIDTAREAGNITLADSLLELIPAFMALQEAANGVNAGVDAANKAFDALQRATEARIKELEKTFTATDLAMKVLEKVVDSEKKRLNEELKTAQESVNTLKKIFDTLTNGIKTLRGEVQQTKGLQVQEARRVIDTANLTGVLPDAEALADAVSTLTGSVQQGLYATSYDKSRAFLTLANDLEKLKSTAEPQLTSAEQTVLNLETQIKQLDSVLENARKQTDKLRGIDASLYGIDEGITLVDAALQQLQTVAKAEEQARIQIDVLNAQLEAFKAQIDILNGIDNSVKSVEQAVKDLGAILASIGTQQEPPVKPPIKVPELADDSGYGTYLNTAKDAVIEAYKAVLGREADQAGLDWWTNAVSTGQVSISDLESALDAGRKGSDIPAFASGGQYQGGLALVGEQGPELINFSNPGMVYTAAQTSNLMSSGNADLIFEIKALRSEVIMLRAEARATAVNTSKTARILDDVTQGGDSVKTEVTA